MSRLESIRKLLAASPHDTFLLYSLGMELAAAGRHVEAAEQFGEILTRDGDYLAAYGPMGQALQAAGDPAGAEAAFSRGIEAAERLGDTHTADHLRLLRAGAGGR